MASRLIGLLFDLFKGGGFFFIPPLLCLCSKVEKNNQVMVKHRNAEYRSPSADSRGAWSMSSAKQAGGSLINKSLQSEFFYAMQLWNIEVVLGREGQRCGWWRGCISTFLSISTALHALLREQPILAACTWNYCWIWLEILNKMKISSSEQKKEKV